MGNFSSKMTWEPEEIGFCVGVDTSKEVEICELFITDGAKASCYGICLSDEQMEELNCEDPQESLKTSCKSLHCAIYTPLSKVPEGENFYDVNANFEMVEYFCNAEQMKAYNKAKESDTPIEVCCGVKSSNKQLGAIIGGTVAGVVVVAAVAVVVWMAVAKKGCFAKKNKVDVVAKEEPAVAQ